MDDNEINQKPAHALLQRLGCEVHVVETGEEALKYVETSPVDVILLDCQLPGIDGYETARQIRANPSEQVKKIPIVALTGNVFPWDRDKCFSVGMNEYMTKPFKLEDIQKVLEKFLKQA